MKFVKFWKVLVLSACVALSTSYVHAIEFVPETTCDRDVLSVMNSRAELEALREMETAQAVILKPDSVLEYSCFRQHADAIGVESGLINGTLDNYLSGNFGYDASSGRYEHSGDPCALMAAVWSDKENGSKCKNADSELFNKFNFWTTDPRKNPRACNDTGREDRWVDRLANAKPPLGAMGEYDPENKWIEPVTGYMKSGSGLLDPLSCEDQIPRDTGLIITDSIEITVQEMGGANNVGATSAFEQIERPDRFCATPGCYYHYDEADPQGPGACKSTPGV